MQLSDIRKNLRTMSDEELRTFIGDIRRSRATIKVEVKPKKARSKKKASAASAEQLFKQMSPEDRKKLAAMLDSLE